jgi:uncharacterized membrane protein
MALVFGVDIPVLEFLLILNIFMLFYIVISMFELRGLIKLKKDMDMHLERIERIAQQRDAYAPKETFSDQEQPAKRKEVYSLEEAKRF